LAQVRAAAWAAEDGETPVADDPIPEAIAA